MKDKILVKIDGSCRQNPHGEMRLAYIIEFNNGEVITYTEVVEAKYGNTLISAEYMALNLAIEKLIALNMTGSPIEIITTSSIVYMHFLGHIRPNRGYYVGEALKAIRNLKRFKSLDIIKVHKKDNIEVANLYSHSERSF